MKNLPELDRKKKKKSTMLGELDTGGWGREGGSKGFNWGILGTGPGNPF